MDYTQLLKLFSLLYTTMTFVVRDVSGAAPECIEYDRDRKSYFGTKDVEYGQCCKVDRYNDRYEVDWHSCEDDGGCCGDDDDQHCCDYDKVRLQIGLGCAAGVVAILFFIFCCIYCCLRKSGVVFRCNGCCKCEAKYDFELQDYTSNPEIRANIRRRQLELEDEIRRRQESRMPHEHDHSERHAHRYERSRTPEVPSAPLPAPTSDAPPSYIDVMNNPSVFPKTDKNADTFV